VHFLQYGDSSTPAAAPEQELQKLFPQFSHFKTEPEPPQISQDIIDTFVKSLFNTL